MQKKNKIIKLSHNKKSIKCYTNSKLFFLKLFFILLTSTTFRAQQQNEIKGIVLLTNSPFPNVNIKNLRSNETVTTDENGLFKINVNPNDTLFFSSIQLNDLKLAIKQKDFKVERIEVIVEKKITFLDEVLIKNSSDISAFSVGVISKKIKKLSNGERKLKTAGDFKPIHLLSILGGSLEVDPILNAISGRSKKIKQEIEVERKESDLKFLENNFYSYLNDDLRLSDTMIKKTFYYAIENRDFQSFVKNGNKEKIKFFLLEFAIKLKDDE